MEKYDVCPGDVTTAELEVATTVSSAATAHGLEPGQTLVIAVYGGPFNIRFGASGVSAPGAVYAFGPGVHKFRVKKSTNTHFRITAGGSDIDCVYWKDSLE